MKNALYQALINRLRNKHIKLASRFHKSVKEGEFQKRRFRKRKASIERLKSLERRIADFGNQPQLKLATTRKHWAVAIAFGVVMTVSAQEAKKPFKERLNKNVAAQLASDLPLAQTVFFDPALNIGSAYINNSYSGDIDGDGDIDLILSSYVDNPIILVNQGGFVFTKGEIPINSNGFIFNGILADFDGDSDLDFFVQDGPYNSPTSSMWLNDGLGDFTEQAITFPASDADGDGWKAADIDGDGDLDIIGETGQISFPYRSYITIFPNNALDFSDTTALKNPDPTDPSSRFVNLMDADGDNEIDIVYKGYVTSVGQSLQVFLGDGLGGFTDSGNYLYTNDFDDSDTLDIDNDGDTDLIGDESIYPAAGIRPLLNNGSGVFSEGTLISIPYNQGVNDLFAEDIDGDGFQDLVVNTGVDSTFLFNGDGIGAFAQYAKFEGSSVPADLDADGDGDLFLYDGSVSTLQNIGGGSFAPGSDLVVVSSTYDIDLVDIDSDGDLDLIQGSQLQSRVWSNDGLANFTVSQEIGKQGYSQVFGDLDADGDPDMIRAIEEGYTPGLDIWSNAGGSLSYNSNVAGGIFEFKKIDLVDVDGDGDLDIVGIVERSNGSSSLLSYGNDGSFAFSNLDTLTLVNEPQDISFGDIDGDTDIDVVIAYEYGGVGFRPFINDGLGNFTGGTIVPPPQVSAQVSDVDLGDLDGDGDLDLFVSNAYRLEGNPAGDSYVFLNDGAGIFTDSGNNLAITNYNYKSFLNDIDQDGDMDIILGGYSSFPQIWTNNGLGVFAFDSEIIAFSDDYTKIQFGDLDGDGDKDIALGGYYFGTKIFLNQSAVVNVPNNTADSLALVDLYNATDGANWTNNTNWLSGTVDTWFGISVIDARVTEVDLGDDGTASFNGNNLLGSLPTSIGDLDSLTVLNLASNQVSGSIPIEIGNLTNLESLLLNDNLLAGDIPPEIGSLASLIELYLHDNFFTGSIPTEVNNLNALSAVLIYNNFITGTVPQFTGSASGLATLNLRANELDSLPDFSSFLSLTDFQVDSNKFTFDDLEPSASVITSPATQKDFGLPQAFILNEGDVQLLNSNIPGVGVNDAYQWQLNDGNIAGAIDTTYTITGASTPDAGVYQLLVTNSLFAGDTIKSQPVAVTISSAVAPSDSLALVDFYNATDGANWTNNTNWLTGPVVTWFGVTTNGSRVSTVDLTGNNLVGAFPTQIGDLTLLDTLELRDNLLSGSIPAEIGTLTSLRTLDLANNQITGSIPPELGNLTLLSQLFLDQNLLAGSIPIAIGNLTDLTIWSSDFNQLTGAIPSEFGNLTQLTTLSLFENNLSGDIPLSLGNLSLLEGVFLNGNQLTGAIPAGFASLANLNTLLIENNLLDSLPDLSGIGTLTTFDLSQNLFTFDDLEPNASVITSTTEQKPFGSPQSYVLSEGDAFTLNSNLPGAGTNDVYQWQKDGANIGAATDTTFTIASVTPADAGIYQLLVTNSLFPGDTLQSETIGITVESSINQTDSLALVALYNATDGANWTNNSNWLTGPVNTWQGVIVIGNRVTQVFLDDDGSASFAGNNLVGTIPSEIGDLDQLIHLSLASNQLSGSVPVEIGNLSSLQRLYLSNNQLSGPIPAELGNLTALNELTLFENQLTGTIPSNLSSLSGLTILFLGDNQLTGVIPTDLDSLTSMVRFDLRNNQLTGTIPTNFGSWSGLQEFGVANNQLTGALPDGFSSLVDITFLDLSGNQFSDLPDLSALTSTTSVGLNDNAFEFDDLAPNASLTGVNYANQAPVALSLVADIQIPVGTAQDISIPVGGASNTYTWTLDGNDLGINNGTYSITSMGRSDMGIYDVSVTNDAVPGLTINSTGPIEILATANITVDVLDGANASLAEQIDGYLLEALQGSSGFDTLAVQEGVTNPIAFNAIVLNDFLISVSSDPSLYIPTYYSDAFEWSEADTLKLFGDSSINVLINEIPPERNETTGQGVVSGTIEEDFPGEGTRVDARRRAARRKCGLKKQRSGGRIAQADDDFELIAYGETNDQGEFEYGFLPEGTYRFFVEYPGIPLDESAFVQFVVGEAGVTDDSFVLAVFASPDGIEIELVLGLTSKVFIDFNIYPNPTTDFLTIEYSKVKNDRMTMEVVDMQGKTLMSQSLKSTKNQVQIDTSEFPSGQYMILFTDSQDESNNSVFRLIKK